MASQWQDRFIDVDGVRTHYLEAGAGETLLLIHGGLAWCSAELTYGAVIEPLSRALHVIAVDYIGYGLTKGRDERDFSASSQGDFLIKFLQQLGGKAHVAGNSHGGWLVQYLAHEAPELIDRLIIINSLNGTSPIPDDYPAAENLDQYPNEEAIRENLLAFYFNPRLVTDERVRRTYELSVLNYEFAKQRRLGGQTRADQNRNLFYRGKHISEWAGQLNKPVLMTWSRENRGASPADATRYLERLSDGELHVITGAGHHVHTEHPERWSAVVTDFLRSPRPNP